MIERLYELFNYNTETGVLTRLVRTSNRNRAGDIAGWLDAQGYRRVKFDGKTYQVHRLVWFYVHGTWPTDQLDHINGVKGDNRITNLREATNSQNQQNQRKPHSRNKNGYLGVTYRKRLDKWQARIKINGTQRHLGLFSTPEYANEAYLQAKRELHPFGEL